MIICPLSPSLRWGQSASSGFRNGSRAVPVVVTHLLVVYISCLWAGTEAASTSINLLLPSLIRVIQHGASAFIEIISVLPINSVCSYVTYFPCSIFFFIRVDHAQCSFPNRDRHTIIAISSCHNKISPLSLWQPLSLCRQNDYCFIKLCGYLVNAFRVPSTHLLPFSWKDKTATCTVSFKLLFNISDLIDTFSFLPLFCLLSATFPYQRGTDRHFLVFKVEKIISF